ncbi:unnamed protein product [Phytomonas sp. EM1]|nr:unnamed protein product [Phytomonas sp. EM1]|eukprot:CCW61998.1 unnamed protein product [Phytomonas sp. isolate EM1]
MSKPNLEWSAARIRQQFIDFFTERGHTFVPGSSVVPLNDPTLLFINAGMNQFKSIFLGTIDPNTDFGRLTRAVNSQMCIRAGGKHNDLDDVGNDTYHHTFFEMLGSWSFGDYFKRDAIYWAWELLTDVYKLPKDRLYATYFEGDPEHNLEPDEEARLLWEELLPKERVLPGNAKDNFWEMGETGPCGPCTEIHYDYIGNRDASGLVNKDDPMVMEIWNLVFIQMERRGDGQLVPLLKKSVDTGMGLERLSSILQGSTSNYDTDLWLPIFHKTQEITGYPYSYEEVRDDPSSDAKVAYRVIADHIRCISVAIADGAMPDSVGRGFVLRRIIRRAIRYGVQFLNAKTGFFSSLVSSVGESLGPFFKNLSDENVLKHIKAVLESEEISFAKTWETGIKHFNRAVEEAKASETNIINGDNAFILHDRYGFPVDLTCLLAKKENMEVDMEEFNANMKASQANGGVSTMSRRFLENQELDELRHRGVPQTKDEFKYVWEEHVGTILAIFDQQSNEFLDVLSPNDLNDEAIGIIMDETNFYAESGGQIYDIGRLVAAEDAVFEVRKVHNIGGYIIHIGNLSKDSSCPIPSGASVQQQVDFTRRLSIAANHTATHQLNWILRNVLEKENAVGHLSVQQRGSLVADNILRFDFSYGNKLSYEQLSKVEMLLNEKIKEAPPVYRKQVPLQDGLRISSVCHIFGEKYPDPVSVICVGAPLDKVMENPEDKVWKEYAIEFCGGTHLSNLRDAQSAVILSEDALTKGVRRIVVVTRDEAAKAIKEGAEFTQKYEELSKAPASEAGLKALSVLNKKIGDSTIPLLEKIRLREKIDGDVKRLNAILKSQAAKMNEKASFDGRELAESPDALASPFIIKHLTEYGADRESLQAFADGFNSNVERPVGLFLLGSDASRALALVTMPSEFVDKKLSAVDWTKAAIGKGGGKPHMAQAGLEASQVKEVLLKAAEVAEAMTAAL